MYVSWREIKRDISVDVCVCERERESDGES